jgi:hypothetical protein
MKHTTRIVAGALLLGCTAAASAEITLYGRENFRGRAVVIDDAAPNLQGTRLNDRASSIDVGSGTWEACSEPNFRGNCVILRTGQYPSLTAAGIGNAISSVREVDRRRERVAAVPADRGVVLFEGPAFSGRSIAVDGVADSLERFNDRARSMIIHEGQWELCEHDRFRGDCRLFGPGRYPTLGALDGDLSRRPSPRTRRRRPRLPTRRRASCSTRARTSAAAARRSTPTCSRTSAASASTIARRRCASKAVRGCCAATRISRAAAGRSARASILCCRPR